VGFSICRVINIWDSEYMGYVVGQEPSTCFLSWSLDEERCEGVGPRIRIQKAEITHGTNSEIVLNKLALS